jgi:hypothetical protein
MCSLIGDNAVASVGGQRRSVSSLAARRRETKDTASTTSSPALSPLPSSSSLPSPSPTTVPSLQSVVGGNVASVMASFAVGSSNGPISMERVRKLESECTELRLKLNDSKKTITLLEANRAELLAAVAVAADRQRTLQVRMTLNCQQLTFIELNDVCLTNQHPIGSINIDN